MYYFGQKIIALILVTSGLFMFSSATLAKSVYVGDNLRVGVREAPSSHAAPFNVVLTGMKLKVLEEQPGFLKIETSKGITGWVKDIYITNTPPAMLQLETLKQELQNNRSSMQDLEDTAKVLEMSNRGLLAEIDALKQERTRLQLDKARSDYLLTEDSNSQIWWWLSLGIVLLAAASFSSGMIWYRQQTMKRLGGLRVL
ncbi:MAG: TIGR04211 family SH3 domain-containing protein [Gammaproteobacteria bacterium]|nr:TIGR04211 family SH3 domain-containing protein [Gammaproteobacteria bacterium]